MGVFQPAAQYWPPDKRFSLKAREMNPGIDTPGDYMRIAEAKKKPVQVSAEGTTIANVIPFKINRIGWFVAAATAAGLVFYLQERKA